MRLALALFTSRRLQAVAAAVLAAAALHLVHALADAATPPGPLAQGRLQSAWDRS